MSLNLERVTEMSDQNSRIESAFSAASQEALQGRSVEPVLDDYPEDAEHVRELLRVTAAVRAVAHPELTEGALANIRQRTLAALREQNAPQVTPPVASDNRDKRWWRNMGGFFSRVSPVRIAVLATAIVLLLGSALVLSGILAPQKGSKTRQVSSYRGIITSIEPTRWLVDDTEILLDDATEIHGTPAVGAEMTCIGEVLAEEQMHALEVWIHEGTKVPPGAPTVPPGDSSTAPRFALTAELP